MKIGKFSFVYSLFRLCVLNYIWCEFGDDIQMRRLLNKARKIVDDGEFNMAVTIFEKNTSCFHIQLTHF